MTTIDIADQDRVDITSSNEDTPEDQEWGEMHLFILALVERVLRTVIPPSSLEQVVYSEQQTLWAGWRSTPWLSSQTPDSFTSAGIAWLGDRLTDLVCEFADDREDAQRWVREQIGRALLEPLMS